MQFIPKKTKLIPLIEGMETFGAMSVKELMEANGGISRERVLMGLEQKYPNNQRYLFNYNKEEYFFSDSVLPNINDRILEIPKGTIEFVRGRKHPYSLQSIRSVQFTMYMDLKDKPEYKFGFDRSLMKVEYWKDRKLEFKLIFITNEEKVTAYYYNPHNLQEAKRLIQKYFEPMYSIELKI